MPTIKDKLNFNFDGIWSDTYGLINVVLDNGLYEETLVSSREIIETKVRGNRKPMLHGLEHSVLQFEMIVAFERKYTDEELDSIIRWLFKDYYRPLYFEGKEDKIYMCMPVDEAKIVHNGLNDGYMVLTMRCDSSDIYSPVVITPLTTVTTTSTITIDNQGHYDIYPEISFVKTGAGKITIESLDDGGSIFEVLDLTNLEDIYLNCEKEIIQTDLMGTYRYDKIIGEFPRLVYGENRFKITGACEIQFRFREKYKF